MKKHITIILMVLMIFVGGFFLGRWTEGKRQQAICWVAIVEAEKRKDEQFDVTVKGYDGIITRCQRSNDDLMRLLESR